MVVKRQCSFCADEIEPGTGTMFVKRDGSVFFFCSSSCRRQQLELGRVGHRLKWTRAHALKRVVTAPVATSAASAPASARTAVRAETVAAELRVADALTGGPSPETAVAAAAPVEEIAPETPTRAPPSKPRRPRSKSTTPEPAPSAPSEEPAGAAEPSPPAESETSETKPAARKPRAQRRAGGAKKAESSGESSDTPST